MAERRTSRAVRKCMALSTCASSLARFGIPNVRRGVGGAPLMLLEVIVVIVIVVVIVVIVMIVIIVICVIVATIIIIIIICYEPGCHLEPESPEE